MFQEKCESARDNVVWVILANGYFIEAKGISSWHKETSQTGVFMLFFPETLLTLVKEHQAISPIILIGIAAFAFTLVWGNLCQNSCI